MTDNIQDKARVVRDNLLMLDRVPHASYAEFAADFRNQQSALHLLQTAIQALIDIASKRCARLGLAPPRSSFDLIEVLESAGHLPTGSGERFAPILGFRNRIVHLYDRIDPRSFIAS
jgi:uncharacterized protein YutE (UPF0331/DUF86 family)